MLWLDNRGKLHLDPACSEIGISSIEIPMGLPLAFILTYRCSACGDASDYERVGIYLSALEKVIIQAHHILDDLHIPQAKGVACDDQDCQGQLIHRLKYFLTPEVERLRGKTQ